MGFKVFALKVFDQCDFEGGMFARIRAPRRGRGSGPGALEARQRRSPAINWKKPSCRGGRTIGWTTPWNTDGVGELVKSILVEGFAVDVNWEGCVRLISRS